MIITIAHSRDMQTDNQYLDDSISSNPSKLEIAFLEAWHKHFSEPLEQLIAARRKIGVAIASIKSELPDCHILLTKRLRSVGLDMAITFDAEDAKRLWKELKQDARFQTYRTCTQIIKDHALLPEQWDCLADMADEIFDTEGEKRSKKYRMRS